MTTGSDSEESVTDEGKRRKGFDQRDVFKKSKKMNRTPTKGSNKELKLDHLINMMHEMMAEIKEIRSDQKLIRDELVTVSKENLDLKEENRSLRRDIQELQNRFEVLDKEKKRNNIVVSGLNVSVKNKEVLMEKVLNVMREGLAVDIGIKDCYGIGRGTCVVNLLNAQDKAEVMKNKNKLKHFQDGKIYIDNDMTKREKTIQGHIRMRAKQEKEAGNSTKIKYRKLIVNGKEFKWNDQLNSLEEREEIIDIEQPDAHHSHHTAASARL